MHIVTGGAGFIGSNIVNALLKINKEIIVCDKIDHKLKKNNISKIKKNYIINPNKLNKFIIENYKEIDSVIHMGAISSTTEKNIKLLLQNNYQYSIDLLNNCDNYSIKFLYASSAATYGNGENGFSDDNDLRKMIKLTPINYYGLSKHLFDLYLLSRINSGYKFSSKPIGLKFFNVYGINEFHKGFMMSPIPKFLNQIKNYEYLNLFKSHNQNFANGEQARDFVYIEDCIRVVLWFLKNKKKQGIFNVGSGKSETFRSLAKIIFKKLNKKINIKYIPTPKEIRKGYQYKTKADLANLRYAGYKNKFTSLKEGVSKYIDLIN